MRALLVAVLVSAPALACAQAAPWNDEAWWEEWGQASMGAAAPTAVLSAQFASPGCYASGSMGGFGTPITAWRYTTSKQGPTQTCGLATAMVETQGLIVDPAYVQRVRGSDTLDNATFWPAFGTIARVADQYTAPDGTLTGDKLTSTTASAYLYGNGLSIASTAGPVTFWGYVRSDTGTAAASGIAGECGAGVAVASCTCTSSGAACSTQTSGTRCIVTATNTTAWNLLVGTMSCTIATAAWYVEAVPSQGGTGTAGYWRMGLTEGSKIFTPAKTTIAVATNTADTVTAVNPISTSTYCIKARVTAPWSRGWALDNSTLWTLGTTDAANSAKLIATSGGTLAFSVFNNAGTVKTLTTGAHGFAAGSAHFIQACNVGGTLSLWDGTTNLGGSITGAGDGVITTQPLAFYLGAGSAEGTESGFAFGSFCVEPSLKLGACPTSGKSRIVPGASRYVWQGMPKEQRTQSRGLTAYPFTWPPDPATRASYRRRQALLDSTTWTDESTTINVPANYDTLNNGMQYRDGSVWYDRQAKRFFSAISSIGPQTNSPAWSTDRWSVFTSANGLTWDFVTYVIPSGASSTWRVWTPEFFADDDGTAYVLVSYSEASGRGFKVKLYRADDPGSFTSWTDLGDIAGTALRLGTNGEIDYHDVFLIKRAGTYHLFSRCVATAGTCVAGEIDHTTSTAIQTGYNTRNVVQYAGPTNLVGEGIEVLEKDDGTFRFFFDDFNGVLGGAQIISFDMATLGSVGGALSNVIGEADKPNRNTTLILGF